MGTDRVDQRKALSARAMGAMTDLLEMGYGVKALDIHNASGLSLMKEMLECLEIILLKNENVRGLPIHFEEDVASYYFHIHCRGEISGTPILLLHILSWMTKISRPQICCTSVLKLKVQQETGLSTKLPEEESY